MTNRAKDGVSAINEMNAKVREALGQIEPNSETRESLNDYYLSCAAASFVRGGGDLAGFIELARSSFERMEREAAAREAVLPESCPSN